MESNKRPHSAILHQILGDKPILRNKNQTYTERPLCVHEVVGAASEAVYIFMKTKSSTRGGRTYTSNPEDLDDWERVNALLLAYPKWKLRLKEMSIVSLAWHQIIDDWETIEKFYNSNQHLPKWREIRIEEIIGQKLIRDKNVIHIVMKSNK